MRRREFLSASAAAATIPWMGSELASSRAAESAVALPRGKAEHCIFLWLGVGMAQIDMFVPKELGAVKASPKRPGS